jgi:hypothetical protein
MQKTLGTTDSADLTDCVLTGGKEADVFRNQVRSEIYFVCGLLLEKKPDSARPAVQPPQP